MESPKEKVEEDGRKTLRHFMKRKLIHPPDKLLRVRIVSNPQPDDEEHIGAEDSSESEFDDFNNDEFQVLSCAIQCTYQLVYKLNSAFSCFELCHKMKWVDVKEFLAAEAMNNVVQTESDIMSIKDELLQQPFSRIRALFCMDYLKVESEDVVYDFIRCWAQTHHPKPEDHCTAKELHLERLIRFTYLTRQKLDDALQCEFFYPESVSDAVIEALAFKAGEPYRRRLPQGWWSRNLFSERRYKRTPITVNRLWFPAFDRCEAYFSLPTSELVEMFHSLGRRESEDFQFGHQLFSLVASCKEVRRTFCFDLSITAKAETSDEKVYATRFMVRSGMEWLEKGTGTFSPAKQENVGGNDLLPGFWTQLLGRNRPSMLDGTLHLCVEITCKR
ncbi:putative BTB/POZ domain-containing protein [Cocos nucifera]|uniref:Putative BTB/POZ domain-containing protein n=1 Tax=Cocos nucifera TaxID=13894 RepID=A0A8K0MVA9_COCNU|nr:putative BTB/POZ domain-containing protein [Cocos nucifera]